MLQTTPSAWNSTGNRRALVLSGGGAKGCWQAGVILALAEAGYRYDFVFGVSVGAINAAQLLQFNSHEMLAAARGMRDRWHKFNNKDIWRHHSRWRRWFAVPWQRSVYSAAPLRAYLHGALDPQGYATSDMQGGVGAVSMTTGRYQLLHKRHPEFIDAVYASAAYPVAFDMGRLDDQWWYDGGLVDVTPLGAAIDAGATHIHAITLKPPGSTTWVPPTRPWYYPKLLDTVTRTLSVLMDNIIEADLQRCTRINEKVRVGVAEPRHRHIDLEVLRPTTAIPVDSLDFNPKDMARGFALGYAYGKGLVPGTQLA